MAGKAYIGTSGFTCGHWREVFYPREVKQREWLEFYGRHFETVEINTSYYHIPRPRGSRSSMSSARAELTPLCSVENRSFSSSWLGGPDSVRAAAGRKRTVGAPFVAIGDPDTVGVTAREKLFNGATPPELGSLPGFFYNPQAQQCPQVQR